MKPRSHRGLSSANDAAQILPEVAAGRSTSAWLSVPSAFFISDSPFSHGYEMTTHEEVDTLPRLCARWVFAGLDCQLQVTFRYPVATVQRISDARR